MRPSSCVALLLTARLSAVGAPTTPPHAGDGGSAHSTDAGADALPRVAALQITGLTSQAIHTHGGPGARVSSARFTVVNAGPEAIELGVGAVDFLSDHGGDCQGPATSFRGQLAPRGLVLESDPRRAVQPTVAVASGATATVEVLFETVEASYGSCDTFAFRVHFTAGAREVVAVANLQVGRVEPLRR